jgi:hypothetical protein
MTPPIRQICDGECRLRVVIEALHLCAGITEVSLVIDAIFTKVASAVIGLCLAKSAKPIPLENRTLPSFTATTTAPDIP